MEKLFKLSHFLDLRGFIRESELVRGLIKRSGPLMDFTHYDNPSDGGYSGDDVGFGYTTSKKKKEVNLAKNLMSASKDGWVIIAPNQTSGLHSLVGSEEFKSWLAEKGYPENYKILLIGSKKEFTQDFESADWFLHDVIGHAIDKLFAERHRSSRGRIYNEIYGPHYNNAIEEMLRLAHSRLPGGMRISEEFEDIMPDIFAAILFDLIDESLFDSILDHLLIKGEDTDYKKGPYTDDEIREAEVAAESIFMAVEEWKGEVDSKSIKVGNNKVYINRYY